MQKKKEYVSPSIEVIEMETKEEKLALSVYDDKTADPNEEVLSNKRRGKWGDLWADLWADK